MYKIFYESKALILPNIDENDVFLSDDGQNGLLDKVNRYKQIILGWLDNDGSDVVSDEVDDPRALSRSLNEIFAMAPAAGGVVCYGNSFVAILRNGVPDLPKGHIEKGELPDEAALREVEEETGISCDGKIQSLPTTFHCYRLNGKWMLKQTYWYVMQPKKSLSFVPQKEEGITEVLTVDSSNIDAFIQKTYRSISEILGPNLRNIVTK